MPILRLRGCLANLLGLVVLAVVLVYGVAAITSPWAFHIGGRWTPLLAWAEGDRADSNVSMTVLSDA